MEFTGMIHGQKYRFSYIAKNLFLVTGAEKEYILYKTKGWHCADEISMPLLEQMGQAIDHHIQVAG
jgi:hypothetical protein